jgi:hypothetical protein
MSITAIVPAILSHIGTFVAPIDVVHLSETCTTMQKIFDTHEFWKNFSVQKHLCLKGKFQEFTPDQQKFLFKTCLFPNDNNISSVLPVSIADNIFINFTMQGNVITESEISKSDAVFKSKFSGWAKEKFSQEKLLLENQKQKLEKEIDDICGKGSDDPFSQLSKARFNDNMEGEKLMKMDPEEALRDNIFRNADQIFGLLSQGLEVDIDELVQGLKVDNIFKKAVALVRLNAIYPERSKPILAKMNKRFPKILDQMNKSLLTEKCCMDLKKSEEEKRKEKSKISKSLKALTEDSFIEELKKKTIIKS